ncbi:MAG: class I SAM-dependent methyltransferase [Candidatus Marinimicrobia bacterium]|nr:class I SAM-dependent methyltransferase [Candidatus Neomarinimicrobiota bacterium]
MKEPGKFWNKIANQYDRQANKTYQKAYSATIQMSKKYLKPDFLGLDFACGTGITTLELSKNIKKMVAIDISEKMINIARQKSFAEQVANIEFQITDLFGIQGPVCQFDVIFAFNILHFFDNPDKILGEIYQKLSPNGLFLSTTDCFGESKTLTTIINSLLSKAGILPTYKSYTRKEMEIIVKSNGFQILETQNLHNHPPNYFISAQKREK